MSTFLRIAQLRRMTAVLKAEDASNVIDMREPVQKAGDKDKQDPPQKKQAGLQVQTTDDEPKHGIHEHKIAGRVIGHTVKAVANGTIAWTAVPTNGQIKGGFKQHEDAKQYLADQHGDTLGKEDQEKQGMMQQQQNAQKQQQMKQFQKSEMVSGPPTARGLMSMKSVLMKAEREARNETT